MGIIATTYLKSQKYSISRFSKLHHECARFHTQNFLATTHYNLDKSETLCQVWRSGRK